MAKLILEYNHKTAIKNFNSFFKSINIMSKKVEREYKVYSLESAKKHFDLKPDVEVICVKGYEGSTPTNPPKADWCRDYSEAIKFYEEKEFTWNDLAQAISSLPESERLKSVHIAIDDENRFRRVAGLETIQEDVYVNNDDDEDLGGLKELEDVHGDDFNIENYRLCTHKGHPFLFDEYKIFE